MNKLTTFFVALICASAIFAADYNCEIRGICYGLDTTDMTAEVIKRSNYYLTTRLELDLYSGSIVIPSKITYKKQTYSVTTIGDDAFYDCSGLKSVKIPNSVTTIGDFAFYDCSGLKSVKIPNSVTTIGENAFRGCSSLKSITIPNSVTTIGAVAFVWCDGLTSINVGAANTHYCSIDGVLFSYAKDTLIQYPKGNTQTEYTIPASVTTIGDGAFEFCSSLKSVTIPTSVTTIGNWAFSGCDSLQSVTIPNSVTTIGDYAFAWCLGLKSVTIPNSVTTIGNWAFGGCDGLQSVTISNSVTTIGKGAFSHCFGLKSVTIPNSVTTIGEGAFEDVDNIVYQGSATGSPWGAKYINGYVDEYLIYKDSSKTTLIFCSSAATGNINIPNSVTTIGNWAFYRKRGLQSIIIPNSVTTIGEGAFAWVSRFKSIICYATIPPKCGVDVFYHIERDAEVYVPASAVEDYQNAEGWKDLQILPITEEVEKSLNITYVNGFWYVFDSLTKTAEVTYNDGLDVFWDRYTGSVVIPETITYNGITYSVTKIGIGAFSCCSGLKSVTIPNSVTTIGAVAFVWCDGLQSVTIPNSVTTIGEGAFSQCSGLQSVTIPTSVTTMGENAFYNVDNIVYQGVATGSPWGAICINGYRRGNLIYSDASKTTLCGCSSTAKGKVTIPNSVTTIGDNAFRRCSGLKSIICYATIPPKCGVDVFYYIKRDAKVYVPASAVEDYQNAEGWKDLQILPIIRVVKNSH